MVERQRWEYRNREETWSVLVTEDSVILQTTAYTRFEEFAERLQFAVNTVLAESEHDGFGVIHRVGLRYIDVVRPSAGKSFRSYLRRDLHGVPDEVFQPGRHLLHVESRGETVVGGDPGTMTVRIVQNDRGHSLPPDLTAAAPKYSRSAGPGELLTLIDMDHYVEGTFDPDPEWVVARACELHDHIVETFHEHVVTGEVSTLPVADQVRELQTALSVNKSELARILRVSRPTVYDWLDDGRPNPDNVSRIRTLRRMLRESRVTRANPLFPRFVRYALEPGGRTLLDVLAEETIDEAAVRSAVGRAKALGDAIDAEREESEARLRDAGFEEPDEQQRRGNLGYECGAPGWPPEVAMGRGFDRNRGRRSRPSIGRPPGTTRPVRIGAESAGTPAACCPIGWCAGRTKCPITSSRLSGVM